VLRQTFADFEIIVVDDGSTDNTKEVVQSFGDPRIRYEYKENGGGFCRSEYRCQNDHCGIITFLDPDDTYLPDALEKIAAFLDAHKEVGFVYGQAQS
jgi:glycosyltransferase involved in cell wall biosynthesis